MSIYEWLDPDTCQVLLKRHHGFHDAQYGQIVLRSDLRGTGFFDCLILLLSHDHEQGRSCNIELMLFRVSEYRIKYSTKYDYPNIRDEVSIVYSQEVFHVNLGFSVEPNESIEDIHSSDIFFVCEKIGFREIQDEELKTLT